MSGAVGRGRSGDAFPHARGGRGSTQHGTQGNHARAAYPRELFPLLRGAGPRLPWLWSADIRFAMGRDMNNLAMGVAASGYLSKASAPDLLLKAVRAVAEGRLYLSPDVAQAMTARLSETQELAQSLSVRELEVLRLRTHGYEVGDISRRLGVSSKTVANHQSSIKQKLGAISALQLILVARQLGLSPGA
jgi:DNA-binding CsgD family transcriptional regulator